MRPSQGFFNGHSCVNLKPTGVKNGQTIPCLSAIGFYDDEDTNINISIWEVYNRPGQGGTGYSNFGNIGPPDAPISGSGSLGTYLILSPVPLPGAIWLLGAGFGCVALIRRKIKR